MALKWRKYDPADYETIAPWYKAHGWSEPPEPAIFPTTGIIVEDGLGPVAVAFLYLSNSPLGFIEWTATRPGLPPGRTVYRVLEYLLEVVRTAGKGSGVARFIHLSRPKSARIYERLGFKKSDEVVVLVG